MVAGPTRTAEGRLAAALVLLTLLAAGLPSASAVVTGITLSDAAIERGDTLVATVEGPAVGSVTVCFERADQSFCETRSGDSDPVEVPWRVPQGAALGTWTATATDAAQATQSAEFEVALLPPRVKDVRLNDGPEATLEPDRLLQVLLETEDHTEPVTAEVSFVRPELTVGPFPLARETPLPGQQEFRLIRTPIEAGLSLGTWDVAFTAVDAGGHVLEHTVPDGVVVHDLTVPVVEAFALRPNPLEVGRPTDVDVSASDNHRIESVTFEIVSAAQLHGPWTVDPVDAEDATHRLRIPGDLPLGQGDYRLVAADAAGNTAVRNGTLVVRDTIAPAIVEAGTDTPFQAPDVQGQGGAVTILAHVEDPTLETVDLSLREPGKSAVRRPMEPGADGTWRLQDTYTRLGDHRYTIIATDAAGNEARSVERAFTILENVAPAAGQIAPRDGGQGAPSGDAVIELLDTDLDLQSLQVWRHVGETSTNASHLLATDAWSVEPSQGGWRLRIAYDAETTGIDVAMRVAGVDSFGAVLDVAWTFQTDGETPTSALRLDGPALEQDGATWIRGGTRINLTSDADILFSITAPRTAFDLRHPDAGSAPYPGPLRLTALPGVDAGDGAYELRWHARDEAGNDEPVQTATFMRDDTPPLLHAVQRGPTTRAVVADDGVGLADVHVEQLLPVDGWTRIDPVDEDGLQTAHLQPVPRGQQVRYRWVASDALGNTAHEGTRIQPLQFTAPNNAPLPTFGSLQAGARLSGEVEVRWQATDIDQDPLTTRLVLRDAQGADLATLGQQSAASGSASWDTTRWPDGDYILAAVAEDPDARGERTLSVLVDNAASDILGHRLEGERRPFESVRIEIDSKRHVANGTLLLMQGGQTLRSVAMEVQEDGVHAELRLPGRGTYTLAYRLDYQDGTHETGELGTLQVVSAREQNVIDNLPLLGAVVLLAAAALITATTVLIRRRA